MRCEHTDSAESIGTFENPHLMTCTTCGREWTAEETFADRMARRSLDALDTKDWGTT